MQYLPDTRFYIPFFDICDMELVIVVSYIISISIVCLFAAVQLYLVLQYHKSKRRHQEHQELKNFPYVTVQLPIYNEKYVVKRLLDSVLTLDYPKDRMEIQILDDSDDETSEIIAVVIQSLLSKDIRLEHIQRKQRKGFKAGALQYGMKKAKGEFIAIFDADFVPAPDFLKKTLPHFKENVGMVQTRWTHINKNYNLLTRVQAFGLDAHFTVEQAGRFHSGKFINFNGTAGVWRKKCIEDAGGWKSNTLTEDLDLSYRAQLKGWKFVYLEGTTSPAELPTIVSSIKSQQYRWNKGAAETARQSIPRILRSKFSLGTKIHGITHLLNSSVYIWLLIATLCSVPMILIKESVAGWWIWNWSAIFLFGFVAITIFYWTASRGANQKASLLSFLGEFPAFIALTSGLALHNSIAVSEGYLGIKTPFIRTPKFNLGTKKTPLKKNEYLEFSFSPLILLEGFLCLYFLAGIVLGFWLKEYGFVLWHLLLTGGYGFVFYRSLRPAVR